MTKKPASPKALIMKKIICCFLVLSVALIAGCRTGHNKTSDSYRPITAGSTWKYKLEVQGIPAPDEVTVTADNETHTYKGKTYYRTSSRSKLNDSTGYEWFAVSGDLYYQRTIKPGAKFDDAANDEVLYLDASKPAGVNWEQAGDSLSVVKMAMKMATTAQIVEKNVSKTVNGKVFNNVIHSRRTITMHLNLGTDMDIKTGADTSLNLGNINQTISIDYFLAKGIGIIEFDMVMGGQLSAKQTILVYDIK